MLPRRFVFAVWCESLASLLSQGPDVSLLSLSQGPDVSLSSLSQGRGVIRDGWRTPGSRWACGALRWQRDSLNEACFVYALLLHGDVLFLVLFLSPYTLS